MSDSDFDTYLVRKLYLPWSIVVLLTCFFLAQSNYVSKSNDSRFYTEQVEKYYQTNWKEIIAPKWGNNYGFEPNSYMRDQFPGQLLIGIAGSKLGLPAKHSLHIIELLFQIASIFIIFNIAKCFLSSKEASIVFYGLLFFPNAFSYNLRANHESGILMFTSLSLLAGLKLNHAKKWILISIVSIMFLLFIKGPFAILGFILTYLGFILSGEFKIINVRLLVTFMLAIFLAISSLWGFETLYKNITGVSFLGEFYRIQFAERALDIKVEHTFIIQKLLNLLYYVYHLLTYSLPWSFLALLALVFNKFKKDVFIKNKLAFVFLGSALSFCFVFSMSNRLAGRYIFPAYYFFTAFCMLIIFENSIFFRRLHQKIIEQYFSIIVISLWSLAFYLHFIINI